MNPNLEIIAELAQGFEGNPQQARLLLKAAASAGASAAKYQLVYADELATPGYKYYELFRSLEMPDEVWGGLATYAKELGIGLQLDIFGTRSLALAGRLGVDAVKLHGTDIANTGLLEAVAQNPVGKILLGAGGAHLNEIEHALNLLKDKQVVVLLGFQGYPTPVESNQIARVSALRAHFAVRHPHVRIGFADHADPESPLSVALPAMAIGAGASVLEKHLTLGKVMKLEDHEAALNPDEFAVFTAAMRDCAKALVAGSIELNDFGMSISEQDYRKMIRRHVVAARDLPAGTVLAPADVVLKRTAEAEPLTAIEAVYGKTLARSVLANGPITVTDLNKE